MSMYRVRGYTACAGGEHRYYEKWIGNTWIADMATCVNLTNAGVRKHRSLPLDDNNYYIHVSPYREYYFNDSGSSGWDAWNWFDIKALACEVFR